MFDAWVGYTSTRFSRWVGSRLTSSVHAAPAYVLQPVLIQASTDTAAYLDAEIVSAYCRVTEPYVHWGRSRRSGGVRLAGFELWARSGRDASPRPPATVGVGGPLGGPIGSPASQTLQGWRRTEEGIETDALGQVTFVPLLPGVA